MKKEVKSYFKSVTKNEFFLLDMINIILGIGILVFTGISFVNKANLWSYLIVFILASILMALNMYKNIKKNSSMYIIFGFFTLMMVIITIFIVAGLIKMNL